jgi:hypothetical protein
MEKIEQHSLFLKRGEERPLKSSCVLLLLCVFTLLLKNAATAAAAANAAAAVAGPVLQGIDDVVVCFRITGVVAR